MKKAYAILVFGKMIDRTLDMSEKADIVELSNEYIKMYDELHPETEGSILTCKECKDTSKCADCERARVR